MGRLRTTVVEVKGWLLRKYLRSPVAMLVLRRHPRLAKVPGPKGGMIRLIVRHDDVVRVLRDDRGFGVAYLPKMLGLHAPFMLGLPRSADHLRLRSAIDGALHVEDAGSELMAASTRAAADALDGRTQIEVIGGLTQYVLGQTIGPYLGLRDFKPQDVERAKAVFRQIFINPFDLPHVRERAEGAAQILRRLVHDEIEARRSDSERFGGVIGRLIEASELDDDDIAVQVVGLLVAWAASVPRGMAYAIDWLLDHPDALREAQVAGASGDLRAMWALLLKGLQARPPAPAVERTCERTSEVHGVKVKCERDLMVVLTSAMQDADFEPEHADEALRHLPFGYGIHQCVGRWISEVQMSAIASELLRRPGVARVCPLKLEGPYPTRLVVTYGVAR